MRLRNNIGSIQVTILLIASFVVAALTVGGTVRGTSGLVLKSAVLYLTWSRG